MLEIRNPDGSLAQRKEFENSLTPSFGWAPLIGVLSGQFTAGTWAVVVGYGANLGVSLGQTAAACASMVASNQGPCSTLSVSVNSAGPFYGALVLQGTTVAATSAGAIDSVSTFLGTCPAGGINLQHVGTGTVMFSVTFKTSGAETIAAADTVVSTMAATSEPVPVSAGATGAFRLGRRGWIRVVPSPCRSFSTGRRLLPGCRSGSS